MTPCRCLVAGVCGCKAPSRPRPSAAVRCLPRALRCACARWCPVPSRLDSGALAQPAAERGEDGGAQRRLDLSRGHITYSRLSWRCPACEGKGFDDLGRCEECCGWGWFLWPESDAHGTFLWLR